MTSTHRPLSAVGLRSLLGVAAAVVLALLPAAPAHALAGPFDPDQGQIFASKGSNISNTRLWELTPGPAAYSFTAIGPESDTTYNALAYNTDDNYLYAFVTDADGPLPFGSLIRIDPTGAYERVGTDVYLDNEVPGGDMNMGAYNPDTQELWAMHAMGDTIHVIDLSDPDAPTSHEVTTSHNGTTQGSDWAFSGGVLFSLGSQGFFRINADGSHDGPFHAPGNAEASSAGGNDQAGAAWTLLGDDLGFSYNGSGEVLRVRVTDPAGSPTFQVVAKKAGEGSESNDGAASPGSYDLSIAKDGELLDGQRVQYTITVTNHGPVDAPGWVVRDELPSGLRDVVATGAGNPTVTGGVLEASADFLPSGESATITVVAAIGSARSLTNVASVRGLLVPDRNPANNEAGVEVPLPEAPAVAAPDTGAERTAVWPAYAALVTGLSMAAALGGRRLIGRREG